MTESLALNLEVTVIVSRGGDGSASKLKQPDQLIPSGMLDPHRPGSSSGGLAEDADISAQVDECCRDAPSPQHRYRPVNGVTLGDAAQIKPAALSQRRRLPRLVQIQMVGSNPGQHRLNFQRRGNRGALHPVKAPKLDQGLDGHIQSTSG